MKPMFAKKRIRTPYSISSLSPAEKKADSANFRATIISDATVSSMSFPQEFQLSDPEWSSEDSCEEKLADAFLEKIRTGYLCSPASKIETHICKKENANNVTYRLVIPGFKEGNICELHASNIYPFWYARQKISESFCKNKLRALLSYKRERGYSCNKEE